MYPKQRKKQKKWPEIIFEVKSYVVERCSNFISQKTLFYLNRRKIVEMFLRL